MYAFDMVVQCTLYRTHTIDSQPTFEFSVQFRVWKFTFKNSINVKRWEQNQNQNHHQCKILLINQNDVIGVACRNTNKEFTKNGSNERNRFIELYI